VIKRHRTRLVALFFLSDSLGILYSFFCSYLIRFYAYIIPVNPERGIPSLTSYIAVFPLFFITHIVIFYIQGFYKVKLRRTKIDDFFFTILNVALTFLVVQAVLSYLYSYSQGEAPLFRMDFKLSHGFLAVYCVVVIFMIFFLRNQIYFFMRRRYAKGLSLQNVLIIGAGEMGQAVGQKLSQYEDLGFVVRGFLDDEKKQGEEVNIDGGIKVLGSVEDLGPILDNDNISDVFIALDLNSYPKILEIFKVVDKYVVNVRLIPDLFQLSTLKASIQDLEGFPVISIDEPPLLGIMRIVKRVMDIAASVFLLVLLSPITFIVGILIKLGSKGPVFYKQERVGLDGRKFILYKFRTMVSDAERETGPVMCKPNDPRVTKIGRFLRKFSIDEMPQLINVLKGEMSLIGPRPERPHFVEDFKEKIPKYMLRHKVKSGITGWAQIHGLRQDTPIDKRLEYDFYYIQNWSLALDLKIIWRTIRKGFIDKNLT